MQLQQFRRYSENTFDLWHGAQLHSQQWNVTSEKFRQPYANLHYKWLIHVCNCGYKRVTLKWSIIDYDVIIFLGWNNVIWTNEWWKIPTSQQYAVAWATLNFSNDGVGKWAIDKKLQYSRKKELRLFSYTPHFRLVSNPRSTSKSCSRSPVSALILVVLSTSCFFSVIWQVFGIWFLCSSLINETVSWLCLPMPNSVTWQ